MFNHLVDSQPREKRIQPLRRLSLRNDGNAVCVGSSRQVLRNDALAAIARAIEEDVDAGRFDETERPLVPDEGERRLSRAELAELRHRVADARWNATESEEDELPLRLLHRDTLWNAPTDRQPEIAVRRSVVVLDALDFLIASLGVGEEVVIQWSSKRS